MISIILAEAEAQVVPPPHPPTYDYSDPEKGEAGIVKLPGSPSGNDGPPVIIIRTPRSAKRVLLLTPQLMTILTLLLRSAKRAL